MQPLIEDQGLSLVNTRRIDARVFHPAEAEPTGQGTTLHSNAADATLIGSALAGVIMLVAIGSYAASGPDALQHIAMASLCVLTAIAMVAVFAWYVITHSLQADPDDESWEG